VLAAAKIAVVFQGAFVEFVSTIVELFAAIAERLHLPRSERPKIAQDREILVEDFHGIDAADGRGDGQAHSVGKCFGGSECAIRDTLSGPAYALHSCDSDAALIGNGQDVAFEAAKPGSSGLRGIWTTSKA
jgi:hypothetical protein